MLCKEFHVVNVTVLNQQLEDKSPHEIIRWAVDAFWPDIAMSSSFQTQSLPLLHIVSQVAPELPIIFIDTGYHFPETLAFRDRLIQEWGLNVRVVKADASLLEKSRKRYGGELYRYDPDLCCYIHKVEPMRKVLQELNAWISGIRRDQTPERADIQIVERTAEGLVRVHPLAKWTRHDVWRYIHEHDLPLHPLFPKGYLSVGCAPCTRPVYDEDDERAGRWDGWEKRECGLHTILRQSVKSTGQ